MYIIGEAEKSQYPEASITDTMIHRWMGIATVAINANACGASKILVTSGARIHWETDYDLLFSAQEIQIDGSIYHQNGLSSLRFLLTSGPKWSTGTKAKIGQHARIDFGSGDYGPGSKRFFHIISKDGAPPTIEEGAILKDNKIDEHEMKYDFPLLSLTADPKDPVIQTMLRNTGDIDSTTPFSITKTYYNSWAESLKPVDTEKSSSCNFGCPV
ncbi:MAG: hypothetical protein WCG05_01460 [Alphaproteobacteria bacterium]